MKKSAIMGLAMAAAAFGQSSIVVLPTTGIELRHTGSTHYYTFGYHSASGDPALYSSAGNSGYLGTSSNYLNEIRVYSYTEHSDARSKEEVRPLEDGTSLDRLKAIRPVSYVHKAAKELAPPGADGKPGNPKREIGFLAQNVLKAIPEAAFHDKKADSYGVQYSRVIPVLLKAIQEQQKVIDAQDDQIKAIKKRMGL